MNNEIRSEIGSSGHDRVNALPMVEMVLIKAVATCDSFLVPLFEERREDDSSIFYIFQTQMVTTWCSFIGRSIDHKIRVLGYVDRCNPRSIVNDLFVRSLPVVYKAIPAA